MKKYSRRDFLKLMAMAAAVPTLSPLNPLHPALDNGPMIRIASDEVSVYSEPDDESTIVYQHYRDDLVNYYARVRSDAGPDYNPYWYRVWRGYIHSARVQEVQYRLNTINENIQETGQIGEITVPYTQAMWNRGVYGGWQGLYRLYYTTIHWVMGLDEGPDGNPWYRLKDELSELEYHVPAEYVRLIQPEEYAPISPEVDPWHKRIEVNLSTQTLVAYENDHPVLTTLISSGLPDYTADDNLISTQTPIGSFNVYSKMPSKHMGDGNLTDDIYAYELPGIAWTTFFAPHGVAFHGTYWHQNFGIPMSHGCINMKTDEARWIFRWTTPVALCDRVEQVGNGTPVTVYA